MFQVGDKVVCVSAEDVIELSIVVKNYIEYGKTYIVSELNPARNPEYKTAIKIEGCMIWFLSKNFAYVDSSRIIAEDILTGRI